MTRLALGAAIGVLVGVVIGAALGIRAEQYPTEETVAAAAEAGVDPLDLQGAENTTGLDARDYLQAVGELVPVALPPAPTAPSGWPFGGALAQRIFCVEEIESSHGRRMWNPRGWPPPRFDEPAQGWLGWLPSTARAWGVVIGDRASEWDGARRMILAGAGGRFYGIAAGRC